MINYEGIYAFSTPGTDFPVKVLRYKGAIYMVPDWGVNHDGGDEDDGLHKMTEQYIREHFTRTVSL